MTESIMDCPYCGSKAELLKNIRPDRWRIHCTKCSAEMSGWREEDPLHQHLDMRDALIQEWHRRIKC